MYENLDTIPTTLFNPNKILGKLYFDLNLIGFTLHCLEISGCHITVLEYDSKICFGTKYDSSS